LARRSPDQVHMDEKKYLIALPEYIPPVYKTLHRVVDMNGYIVPLRTMLAKCASDRSEKPRGDPLSQFGPYAHCSLCLNTLDWYMKSTDCIAPKSENCIILYGSFRKAATYHVCSAYRSIQRPSSDGEAPLHLVLTHRAFESGYHRSSHRWVNYR